MHNRSTHERFYSLVSIDQDSGCYNWVGAKGRGGYGLFGGVSPTWRTQLAHRFAWELEGLPLPLKPLVLRHKCDNSACVNVSHLEPGTVAQNNFDKVERNRTAYGVRNNQAKLDDNLVAGLRYMNHKHGWSGRFMGKFLHMSNTTVCDVLSHKTWKRVVA